MIEHSKISHKLSKTIRQVKKVFQLVFNSSLYEKKTFEPKNVKIAKRTHAFKGYASSYNVKISNSFNTELQLKRY